MRRFALVPVVLLLAAVFVAAWVNAQEGSRRRVASEPTPAPTPALLPVDAALQAPAPILADRASSAPMPLNSPQNDGAWKPRQSMSDSAVEQIAGQEEALETARRLFRGGSSNKSPAPSISSTPKTAKPIAPAAPAPFEKAPVEEPITEIVEEPMVEAPRNVAEGIPSVLKKKKAGSLSRSSTPSEDFGTSRRSLGNEPEESVTPSLSARSSSSNRSSSVAPIAIGGTLPKIHLEATGPSAVTLGKPAEYLLRLTNESNQTANGLEVRIGLPAWVELQGGEGTHGEAKNETDAAGRRWLVWVLNELKGSGTEQLRLTLVVKQNQPFELAMQWSMKPQAIVGEIAVREPQIEVRLEGPSDMLYGDQKNFTLHVSNPGTGDAENVSVNVSSGGGQPNRLEVGSLAAGEQKHIPFGVSATAPGEMEIRATATADGGLTTQAASRVIVHRAQLQVTVAAPQLKFAGSEVAYQVMVANTGDATAEQVVLGIELPQGAKYVGGIDGAASAGDGLNLKVGNLAPSAEKTFEVRCILLQAGENKFTAKAQGKGDLVATESAATQVEALADLKLTVNEPTGPVPVGTEAVYEVHVANRGTKAAENVKITVQFAEGIEPTAAEGNRGEMANGQVMYDPLPRLEAGKELVLRVKARTEKSGSHQFRVEVKAGDPETRLVSEGVTRCFSEGTSPAMTARKPATTTAPKSGAPSLIKQR